MQISYHSFLTKIQKLQNLKKKKKKTFFCTGRYCPKLVGTAGTAGTRPVRPVFFPERNRGVECTGLLAGTVYSGRTGRYGTKLTTLDTTEHVYIVWGRFFEQYVSGAPAVRFSSIRTTPNLDS